MLTDWDFFERELEADWETFKLELEEYRVERRFAQSRPDFKMYEEGLDLVNKVYEASEDLKGMFDREIIDSVIDELYEIVYEDGPYIQKTIAIQVHNTAVLIKQSFDYLDHLKALRKEQETFQSYIQE